jgi:hypothetical protein
MKKRISLKFNYLRELPQVSRLKSFSCGKAFSANAFKQFLGIELKSWIQHHAIFLEQHFHKLVNRKIQADAKYFAPKSTEERFLFPSLKSASPAFHHTFLWI